jgi:hypothetical protein
MTYRIEKQLQQVMHAASAIRLPRRAEFQDPVVASLQGVALSRVIDEELDRFYNPLEGPVNAISRVFRHLRGR